MDAVVFPSVGTLLVVLGGVMGRRRPNWTTGIRTPWTLADERVWDKTHRVAGRLMVAAVQSSSHT